MSQYPIQTRRYAQGNRERYLERKREEYLNLPAPKEIDTFQSTISNFLNYGAKGHIEAIRWFIDAEASSKNGGQAAKALQKHHTLSTLNKFMEELHLFTTGDLFSHKNADLFKLSLEIAEACGFSNRDKNQLRTKYQERISKK